MVTTDMGAPDADGGAVLTCRVCGQPRELVDAVSVNDQVFAVCAACEAADPTFVRRTGSTARILGFEVQDVRGQLR